MRRFALACSALGSLIAAGCTQPGPESNEAPVSEAQDPISWGTPDNSAHTAVVAILIPGTGGTYSECSGSIVKNAGGVGYVLTAAHCCYDGAPTIVTNNSDYSSAVNALFGGPLSAGVYKVVSGSVYYHAQFDINILDAGHDFCMLKFTASGTLPVLGLPAGSGMSDGLAQGVAIEHVGYGETNNQSNNTPNPNNSVRYKGTNSVSFLNTTIIYYDQGGTVGSHVPGTCQGDSGGPALIPAGAAQSQQVVVGVTSFGGLASCGQTDQGGADRVRVEIGPGKFITSYLNDTPIGNQPGQVTVPGCSSCEQSTLSPGGACASTYSACTNNTACDNLLTCLSNCPDQPCADNCWNAAGATGQNLYNGIIDCICNTGCTTECATECGGSSSSSSSGSMGCGFQSSDPACNTCLTSKCCSQGSACANNTTCTNCITDPTPPTSCNSNSQYTSFVQCLSNNCASACGISSSSSSSSSSSGSASSSSSSGSTSSSSSSSAASSGMIGTGGGNTGGSGGAGTGTGTDTITGGAPGTGTGTGATKPPDSDHSDPNQSSGCSASGTGTGSEPGSSGSIAALALGVAIAFARRRKNA